MNVYQTPKEKNEIYSNKLNYWNVIPMHKIVIYCLISFFLNFKWVYLNAFYMEYHEYKFVGNIKDIF